jgi:hypothetical protein
MGIVTSFPRDKADYSPPCGIEVKNVWSYIFTPQYVIMEWCLIKQEMHLYSWVLSSAQGEFYLMK